MAKVEKASDSSTLAPDRALSVLRQMLLIRRFEERAEEQYTRARIGDIDDAGQLRSAFLHVLDGLFFLARGHRKHQRGEGD